ncbi:kelch-like protein 18 [Paramacrobiotus metropolitanus]|uniref:kelch-like protein 18 n=1 Tax=Paramacrobiotus metropolitanus TaxID=2943436 RepID=UPI002445F9DB|nr:kelch-like protein 18 [Paramacrobiotus metropolitanus]
MSCGGDAMSACAARTPSTPLGQVPCSRVTLKQVSATVCNIKPLDESPPEPKPKASCPNPNKTKPPSCNKTDFKPDKLAGCKAKNVREGLSMSVEIPERIDPNEIDSAYVCITRSQDEILWSVGKVVQDFHKRNHFHDASLKTGNGEALAHRYVLCASSEWMSNYIHNEANQAPGCGSHKQLIEIRLDNCLEAPAVCQIVDYMYTARCRLNYFNFYPVFQAATYLKMPTIIHACQRLMTHLMADENLAIMLEIAEQAVKSEPLVRFVYRHWVEKFYNQVQACSFLDWPFQRVYRLLCNDDIRVNTEMDVFKAALRWINHDRCQRTTYFNDLMKLVRWVYMTQDELVQAVEMDKMLISSKDVKQLITDAQWFKTCQEHKHNWKDYSIPASRLMSGPLCRSPRPGEPSCPASDRVYPKRGQCAPKMQPPPCKTGNPPCGPAAEFPTPFKAVKSCEPCARSR